VQVESHIRDLARAEADAMIDALDAEFAPDGIRFVAPDPARWYLRIDAEPELDTTPLWRAIGHSMRRALPTGADGARWRARLNEAPILLHGHPVNAARELAGAPRVGSIWLWGGGTAPEFERPQTDRVVDGPGWLRAAADKQGIPVMAGGELDAELEARDRRTLVVATDDWEAPQDGATRLAEWDRRWFVPLAEALASRRIGEATLLFAADAGSLSVRCNASVPPRRFDWRRWLGKPAQASARTLDETLRATLAREQ
jgi:hypothetical protein